jgi:hypothetical protein
MNSAIVKSTFDCDKIKEWLASVNKTSEPKLLYRSSRDGWDACDFHRWCDSKGATITVVKCTEGNVFGGYTSSKSCLLLFLVLQSLMTTHFYSV